MSFHHLTNIVSHFLKSTVCMEHGDSFKVHHHTWIHLKTTLFLAHAKRDIHSVRTL
jgi:hypothetical protein